MGPVSVGDKVLVEVPRSFVADYPVPANGMVLKKIVGISTVLIEEVCVVHDSVEYFNFPLEYIVDMLSEWVFATKVFKKSVPIIPYSNRLLFKPTRENVMSLVDKCVKEIRCA